jgi:GNAT superfamily N-acetyltransferase
MSVYVKPIPASNDSLRQYVKFGIDLYKDNPYYVPPLIYDEIATLSPEKNPAYDFCEAQCFMALRNGEPVGRITALINKKANEKFNEHVLRFGWLDFIDDPEVVDALFAAAEQWGKERGMDRIVGPMGFTDMDHEGMLTFGFDEAGTMATIYNYEYYPKHMERLGFDKEVDWVEYRMTVPDAIPDKYERIAKIVAKKYELRCLKFTSRSKLKKQYGHALFELINEAYDGLYGYTALTDKQIDGYIEQYIGVLRLEDVSIVVDKDDKLVAVGIAMPSLSDALRKGKGKLFPTGWWHLLQAIKGKTDVVDLLLVAVKPEYQSKGVNALLFSDLIPAFIANGYKYAESNLELEENESVQKQWEYFERRLHRRRRAWQKAIK